MSNHSTAEEVEYQEEQRPVAVEEVEANEQAHQKHRLSPVEKVAFGIAATFSAVVLMVCLSLTVLGFIFSPIADTLVFAMLAVATGTTSYAIWRGGRRNAA
ncbi:MAG: hypothetical protein M1539_06830 [Actinobacteria bacterium]|nr:hypothetical protein [Actinomycetota bacterium]MCL5883669.1 hypothetical protein [Actinomycetota bacterium]